MAKILTQQYHEDTTEKRALQAEDIDFLIKLQKELNTQDSLGTRDPKFWTIIESEKVWDVAEDTMDGLRITDGYSTVVVAELEEALDTLAEYLGEKANGKYTLSGDDERGYTFYEDKGDRVWFPNLVPMFEFLNFRFDDADLSYDTYRLTSQTRWNELFLTNKEASEYLKKRDYAFSDDAHTFCLCAGSSEILERLVRIIRETEWNNLTA